MAVKSLKHWVLASSEMSDYNLNAKTRILSCLYIGKVSHKNVADYAKLLRQAQCYNGQALLAMATGDVTLIEMILSALADKLWRQKVL